MNLRRGYEAPFLVRPGRLPLWQGLSERRLVYRDRSPPGPESEFPYIRCMQTPSIPVLAVDVTVEILRPWLRFFDLSR